MMIRELLKPIFLTMAFAAGACGYCNAQNAVKMSADNGRELIFMLSSHPSAFFQSDALVIETDQERIVFDDSAVVSFQFVDVDDTSVDTIDSPEIIFKIYPNLMEIFNLKPASDVKIYDLSGKLIKSMKASASGNISYDISNLAPGCFIVKTFVNNFKFFKK
ncbi:MAG: T9SS type A sorting domain-containing protein [Muribaculaceae bacterium]|nr:T9SS type A sorting domain-containing protein [Muribaculaceae bacterium]